MDSSLIWKAALLVIAFVLALIIIAGCEPSTAPADEPQVHCDSIPACRDGIKIP